MAILIRIFLLLLVAGVAVKAQPFEGTITYQNAYQCKIPNVTNEAFTAMMGTSITYSIKGASYKTASNGTLLLWQLYLPKDNKLYTKFSNSPAVLWNDAAVNSDEVLKSELNKEVVDILGYKCDELILTCKSGVQKYYFNSKLKMDAKLFENHKYGNFYDYVSKANAIPLKVVVDNVQYSLESTATAVQAQKIDEAIFALPENVPFEKSPY